MTILTTDKRKSSSSTRVLSGTSQANTRPRDAARQRRGSAALGTTRITITASDTRSERWAMRDVLNDISRLARVRKCGKVPIGPLVSLKTSGDKHGSGYGGLHTCGSVWVCPVCAGKIAAHRRLEVEQLADYAVKSGAVVSLLTLTQRHHKGQSLEELWAALSHAWNRVTSTRKWAVLKEQLGLVGYVKATEVTHGKHGWHVHVHVLIISEKNPRITPLFYQRKQGRRKIPYPVEVVMPSDVIADRWKTALAQKNVDFLRDRGGLDWQTAAADDVHLVGRYVAKLGGGVESLASETTLGAFKKARRGNRTPFQILADFMTTGDEDDLRLWHTWEKVSRGKRALTWSRGLRDWAELEDEKTDEEIAEEDTGGETVALFDKKNWKKVRKAGAVNLLNVLDSEGVSAAHRWLKTHGIAFLLSVDDYHHDTG